MMTTSGFRRPGNGGRRGDAVSGAPGGCDFTGGVGDELSRVLVRQAVVGLGRLAAHLPLAPGPGASVVGPAAPPPSGYAADKPTG